MVKSTNFPKFSVILPTYNRADVIGCAIESIIAQTYSEFELLVAGDGCTDDTERVVKKYTQKDKRIKWFPFPKAPGFGYNNRDKVLKTAKGTLIAYIGHDDVWLPNHLEIHLNFFQENKEVLIAYSKPLWMSEDGIIIPSFFNLDAGFMKRIFMLEHNEIPATCFVVRQLALMKAGMWIPGTFRAGDWDLWRRVLKLDPKRRVGYIPIPSSLNFKSNWRTDSEYLNDHLRVIYDIITSSVELKQLLLVPKKGKLILWQRAALLRLADKNWLNTFLKVLPQATDEIIYRLTLSNAILARDKSRLFRVITKVKRNPVYKAYLSIRKLFSRSGPLFTSNPADNINK